MCGIVVFVTVLAHDLCVLTPDSCPLTKEV
jgi:hypothetical protein